MPHTDPATMPAPPPPGAPPAGGAPAGGAPADIDPARIAAMAKPPKGEPFKVKDIMAVVDEFNATLGKLAGKQLEGTPEDQRAVVWTPPEGEKTWAAPLPPELFVPLYALDQFIAYAEGGRFAKFEMNVHEIEKNEDLKLARAQLKRMGSDKALVKFASGEAAAGEEAEMSEDAGMPAPGAQPPSELTEADRRLMEAMPA